MYKNVIISFICMFFSVCVLVSPISLADCITSGSYPDEVCTYVDVKDDSDLAKGIHDIVYSSYVFYSLVVLVLGWQMATYFFKR
jgi:hypothetical protein